MAGYSFTTASQIATGLAVLASTYTTEFTALQSAFSGSTGHSHSGGTGEGPQIATGGLADLAVTTAKLAATAVTTAKLTDANVTYAKIQNVSATDKLLGRSSSGAGVVEEIVCTAAGRAILDDADSTAQRTTLGLGGLATLSTVGAAQIDSNAITTAKITDANVTYAKIQNVTATDRLLGRSTAGAGVIEEITCTSFARSLLDDTTAATARTTLGITEPPFIIAISDETTAITTGTAKVTFRMPYAYTLTAVRASLTTASSSGIPTFDINENGTTILSTKLTIDANEKTSTTAATLAVISDASLADDAEITIDIDVAGTDATGAKIYMYGYKS